MMFSMPALIVISDLHMGSGQIDDFEPEIQQKFVSFLQEWRSKYDAIELVINGDLLDFVQAPPYKGKGLRGVSPSGVPLCFTEKQSLQKLDAIYKDHEKSFEALGAFLRYRAENRLVILPGNHDADFYWKAVQARFRQLVCGEDENAAARLIYWLEPVYRPSMHPHIWIEHGHQHDDVNSFFIDKLPCWSESNHPIRTDKKGVARLYECIGTRFLILYLNDLDKQYPYVDNIKPFSRFLQLFGASALKPGYGSVQAAVAVAAMSLFLARSLATHPKDILHLDNGNDPVSAASYVLAAFEAATPSQQKTFIRSIIDNGYPLRSNPRVLLLNEGSAASFLEFLSQNLDLLAPIDRVPQSTLKLGTSFRTNETDLLSLYAKNIIKDASNAAKLVIMGHTHEVVDKPDYINTGSWTRYYQLRKKEKLRPWAVLRKESWKEFPYKLNFVLAKSEAGRPATLETYE
jgi:UDP-2,3-diacylglucosamine pyrophosphatase LpxH